MADLLSEDALAIHLEELPGWEVVDGKLHREVVLDDFVAAFGLMAQVAISAEKLNHHPEWSNVWNKVTIDLMTHDIGTLSELDVELAKRVNRALPD